MGPGGRGALSDRRPAGVTLAPPAGAALDDSPPSRAAAAAGARRVVFGFLELADGGAERLTLTAARHLDRDRFLPSVLCAGAAGPLAGAAGAAGLEVESLGRLARPFDFRAVAAIAARLRWRGADILHVPLFSRASPYLRAAARRAGTAVVVAHEWSRPCRPGLLRRLADRWLDRGTRYVAASAAQRADLLAAGVAPSRVVVVRSGIEVERFGEFPAAAARRDLGLPPDAPVIVVAARLEPVKGHVDLLAALPRLLDVWPRLRVLVAGEGSLAASLRDRIGGVGLSGVVDLLGAREDIARLLAAADLAVLPSRMEGIPSFLLEAMAARRALVACRVGGVAEAVTEGVEGLLVPPNRPEALAAAAARLLADESLRREMGERGRARVEREFRVETTARRLEALYSAWLAPG